MAATAIVAEVEVREEILMVLIVVVVILEVTVIITTEVATIITIVVVREVDQEVLGVDLEVEDDTMVLGATTAMDSITLPKTVRIRETDRDVAMP